MHAEDQRNIATAHKRHRDAQIKRLRAFRARLPDDFKFDAANARQIRLSGKRIRRLKDFVGDPNDLFSAAAMQEIAEIIGVDDQAAIADLQASLKSVGAEYRRIISITPCDLPGAPSDDTLSQRLAWVDAQLLNPIAKLLEALDPENRHMLSLWPEEPDPELIPDYDAIGEQLKGLQVLGQNLAIIIAKCRFHDLPPGPLIRYRIVAAIAEVLDGALPDLRPSRGTYDATTKQFYGVYPALVRRIFLEITGLNEQLDRLIKEQVDQRRR